MSAGVASAAPTASKPTVSQLKAKLQKLSTQADTIDEQLDQYQQEENSASQRLTALNNQLARYQNQFKSLRAEVAQIATAAYEQGSINSPEALLTSSNPQQILDQSSILLELSASNSHQMTQFLNTARQITNNQQAAKRTKDGIAALKAKEEAKKKQNAKVTAQAKSALAALTPAQQEGTMPGSSGGTDDRDGSGPGQFSGRQGGQVRLRPAWLQVHVRRHRSVLQGLRLLRADLQAWAAAGVSIERTSEEQWDSLPHVSTSDLEPGDILVFDGEGHVGIYVGGGRAHRRATYGCLRREGRAQRLVQGKPRRGAAPVTRQRRQRGRPDQAQFLAGRPPSFSSVSGRANMIALSEPKGRATG